VWAEKSDVVEIVQVTAIGVAKHLCNGNADNALELVLGTEVRTPCSTALRQIMDLVLRSDSVTVKSEGTRVLGNAIKSLANDPTPVNERRKAARNVLATSENASALAALIGRSKKYPMLINEGVVALSFLSTQGSGTSLVIDALIAPLPHEAQQPPQLTISPVQSGTTYSNGGSPVVGPGRALDTLVNVLKRADSRCPIEVRANICTLLGQVGRKSGAIGVREDDVEKVREATREILQGVSQGTDLLAGAAKRTLEAWA